MNNTRSWYNEEVARPLPVGLRAGDVYWAKVTAVDFLKYPMQMC